MNKSMAISKAVLVAVLLICGCSSAAHSQEGTGTDLLPCIQELLPCQPYLKDPSSPKLICCQAILKVVSDETQCLCRIFTNPALLQSLNVTKEDALTLAKSCGSDADESICGTATAPSGSDPSPTASPNSTKSPVASPPAKSAASMVHNVGGSVWVAAILSFIAWAF